LSASDVTLCSLPEAGRAPGAGLDAITKFITEHDTKLFYAKCECWSRCSSVYVVARLRAGRTRNRGSIPGRSERHFAFCRGCEAVTHFTVLWLRKSGTIPPLPHMPSMVWSGMSIPFRCAYFYRQSYSKCAHDVSHCNGCCPVHYALFYSRAQ
jgi:hypothetical protein